MKLLKWLGLHPLPSLALIALLGGIAAMLFAAIAPYILWLSWEQVVKPPPKATHVFTMQAPMLYIRADDKALYACDLRLKQCEQATQIPRQTPTRETLTCPAIAPITPILVDNIVETQAKRECYPNGYRDVHFIVLADGSVWMGRDYYRLSADEIASLSMVGGAGAVIGLLIGMMIIVWLWTAESKNRRRRVHPTSTST